MPYGSEIPKSPPFWEESSARAFCFSFFIRTLRTERGKRPLDDNACVVTWLFCSCGTTVTFDLKGARLFLAHDTTNLHKAIVIAS